MAKAIIIGIALAACAFPACASADTIDIFALRYLGCTERGPEKQEEIRASCASARRTLTAEASPYLALYYPDDRIEAANKLQLAMTYAERGSQWAARRHERYTETELLYIDCLTRKALADEKFKAGKYLVGREIEHLCRCEYDDAFASFGDGVDGRKAKSRILAIKNFFSEMRIAPVRGEDVRAWANP